jgi:hypothetical protein
MIIRTITTLTPTMIAVAVDDSEHLLISGNVMMSRTTTADICNFFYANGVSLHGGTALFYVESGARRGRNKKKLRPFRQRVGCCGHRVRRDVYG